MLSILRNTNKRSNGYRILGDTRCAVHLASRSLLDVLSKAGGSGKLEDEYPVTPLHLLDACASRMEAYKNSHALVEETLTRARDQAAAGEAKWMSGRPSSTLDGFPLAVKGNFLLKDVPMNTARTHLLRDHVPSQCASLVYKLSGAGSIYSGKSYVNEFGIGAVEMTVQPDAVLSPWYSSDDKSTEARFVGGRSGGPAVAVATGMAFGALASDVLGSLRLPAAYAGVVGLKASKGRLSRQGLLSLAGEWETPGVVARTVSDAALLLAIIQGKDTHDVHGMDSCKKLEKLLDVAGDHSERVQEALPALLGFPEGEHPLQGMRIGVVDLGSQGVHVSDTQAEALNQGLTYLNQAGATVESIDLPDLQQGVGAMYQLATADILKDSSNLGKMMSELGFAEANTSAEVCDEVRSILSCTRSRGLEVSQQSDILDDKAASIARNFTEKLNKVHALLMPSALGIPPTVAEASQWGSQEVFCADAINATASLAGAPAMTVPIALASKEGLPQGLQIIAAPLQEARLLAIGHVLERGAQSESRGSSILAPLHAPDEGKAPISTM